MQANDVRLLKSAAIPALATGLVVAVVAAFLAGTAGLLGAVIGVFVVAAFFVIGLVAVAYASRISPAMMMVAAMATFFSKIIILALVLSSLGDVTAWHPMAFTWAVILCTIAWTVGEARGFMRLRMLYVEPGTKVPGSTGER